MHMQKNAWVDSNIFTYLFHKEFVPAVRNHTSLPVKALLLLYNAPAHPDNSVLPSSDKSIKGNVPTTEYYCSDIAHGSEQAKILEATLSLLW